MFNRIVKYFLDNRLITWIILIVLLTLGIVTAPFNWQTGFIPRDPVPVDAIPDIGDNQQIVATEWMGRSPKDIQDQVTYPLTTALLGYSRSQTISGVLQCSECHSSILSLRIMLSFTGAVHESSKNLILYRQVLLPQGVQPTLGPDATALGQIFWYTLEGT